MCALVLVASVLGWGIWAYQRRRSGRTAKGIDPRWDDKALRDRDEADRAERTVGAADVARAEQVVDHFARVLGNSDAMYDAFANISRAGGAGPWEETMQRGISDPGLLDRPWWWLAVAAERANDAGQPRIAAKIAAFTEMFVVLFLPRLNLAGSMDAGLNAPPAAARARIGAAGLAALATIRPAATILGQYRRYTMNDGASMDLTAGAIERQIASTLVELDRTGTAVDADALPLARAILAGNRPPRVDDEEVAVQVAEVVRLSNDGRHAEAIDVGTRLLAQCREAVGPEAPATLRAAAFLSVPHRRTGDYYAVVALLDPIQPVAARVLGPDHATTSIINTNLGIALRETNRADRALALLEEAVAASVRTNGPDDRVTLTIQSDLALTQVALGQYDQAIALLQRIADLRQRTLGNLHADTLASMFYLGHAYADSQDYIRAAAQLEAALSLYRNALGADHAETLAVQHRLAGVYWHADREDEAISLYEATLAAWHRTVGERHANALRTQIELASTLIRRDAQRALALAEAAAALARESLPANDPVRKEIETALPMTRIMAAPRPDVSAEPAPRPPRFGPQQPLRQVATFASPSKDMAFGHAWSPSGDRIAVAGFEDAVLIFDVSSGAVVARTERLGTCTCVSWSPDGQMLAAGTSQRSVHLFRADTAQEARRTTGHDDEIRCIAFSPDGRYLATAANDGNVCVWSATDLSAVRTIRAHDGLARSVAWSPDSTRLASGGQDGAVRLWSAGNWVNVGGHKDHTAGVALIGYSPDGQLLASGSLDCTARVWNVSTRRHEHVLEADGWWVLDVAFSADSRLLAAITQEEILVFDLGTDDILALARKPRGASTISWRPGTRQLVTVGWEVTVWDLPG